MTRYNSQAGEEELYFKKKFEENIVVKCVL